MPMARASSRSSASAAAPTASRSTILEALKRSGYPFEMELMRDLDAEGLDPVAGFRLRVAEGTARPFNGDEDDVGSVVTREVDVMSRVHVSDTVRSEGKSSAA